MLIGICGGIYSSFVQPDLGLIQSTGIAAGKSSIATYLIKEHNFTRIHLDRTSPAPAIERSASCPQIPKDPPSKDEPTFQTVEALLEFVTSKWQQHWVTTDIWDEKILDWLLHRPFFLLVSVDAPITLRWERFKARYVLPIASLQQLKADIVKVYISQHHAPLPHRLRPQKRHPPVRPNPRSSSSNPPRPPTSPKHHYRSAKSIHLPLHPRPPKPLPPPPNMGPILHATRRPRRPPLKLHEKSRRLRPRPRQTRNQHRLQWDTSRHQKLQ